MTEVIDQLIAYLNTLNEEKFLRVFWFFLFFEFARFFLFEVFILSAWLINYKNRRKKLNNARTRLFVERPLVSVIVPGKNEGKHLYKLVMSLQEQTYPNLELIVIDDGSDDDTAIIGKSLEKNGLIDLFLRNEVRGGKASAANLGYRYSKGAIIVHIDADCSYDNDAIEKIITPFYKSESIGAVGGNILVRNYKDSLCTALQSIEYANTISTGRITSSYLGIYYIVSGAFGAFKREALERLGGWDVGPGLDGDITVKLRKLNYKIAFEPEAICQTNVPDTFGKLIKQRMRWDKSLVRFRLRKHRDIFYPNATFIFSNLISSVENIFYNLILNFKWWLYFFDVLINFPSQLLFIFLFNFILYCITGYLKFLVFSLFRYRKNASTVYFLLYIPALVFYFGLYLRIIRTIAYIDELFFKRSYKDSWNPSKSSINAKKVGL